MLARIFAFVAALSLVGSPASAEVRQPTGKWIVNFADAECVATRNYGTDSDPIYLVLKQPALGEVLQIAMVRKGVASQPEQTVGEVSFDQAPPVPVTFLEFGGGRLGQHATLANLPAQNLAGLRQASTVRISAQRKEDAKIGTRLGAGAGGRLDEVFAVTQMAGLMTMLDKCAADLRTVWHVWDYPGMTSDLKEGPTGNLSSIFSSTDYPEAAISRLQSGTTAFVLLIDEQGKIADCTTVSTSGVASLDAQGCAIVKERAKFKPATGTDGKPTKSVSFNRVTWRIQ